MGPDCFDGWATYPANIDDHGALSSAATLLGGCLSRPKKPIFTKTVSLYTVGILGDGMSTLKVS